MTTVYRALDDRGLAGGLHACKSCDLTHSAAYELWCQGERRRLFPQHFERWTEAEHASRHSGFTWADQVTLWEHRDVWEAWFDGKTSLEAARQYVAALPPLPKRADVQRAIRSLARRGGKTPGWEPAEPATAEEEADLLALARARHVPEPEDATLPVVDNGGDEIALLGEPPAWEEL